MTHFRPFINYNQQIYKLKHEKELEIHNDSYAIEKLKDYSYFGLISGYKEIFYNKTAHKYRRGVAFEDIVKLFEFDCELRELFLKEILYIEQRFSSLLSYYFCETFTSDQNAYLDINNYSNNNAGVAKLIGTLNKVANIETKHEYIIYQRNTYNNVPLWAALKAMTFGSISKMYSFLQPSIRSKIAHEFSYVNETHLEAMMELLVDFRNVCAHRERLYCHKATSNSILDTPLHDKLNISRNGSLYIQGKNDLFAVVIALRYLLPKERFVIFKKDLAKELTKVAKMKSVNLSTLYDSMGFPYNWKKITSYKLKKII